VEKPFRKRQRLRTKKYDNKTSRCKLDLQIRERAVDRNGSGYCLTAGFDFAMFKADCFTRIRNRKENTMYVCMYVFMYVCTYVCICMYVCMFHHITTKLLRSIDTTFILSKNNELTLNGIYIVNYSVSFKNSNVRKVYKFNSQFQG